MTAALLTTTCAGCGQSNSVTRAVAGAPGYLRPAVIAPERKDDDAIERLALEKAARVRNEKVINAARHDWNELARTYREGKP